MTACVQRTSTLVGPKPSDATRIAYAPNGIPMKRSAPRYALAFITVAATAHCVRPNRQPNATRTTVTRANGGSDASARRPAPPALTVTRASLDEITAMVPRSRAQLHLVHLAQLHRALRGRESQFDDRDFEGPAHALYAAMAAPTDEDLRLAAQLALAAPALSSTILDAIASFGGTGGAWDHDNLAAPRRDAAERIIRSGPAESVVWAIRSGFPGERHAASFAREQLERASRSNECPRFNSMDRSAAERLFAGQPPAPCLSASPDPRVYERMTTDALIDAFAQEDEAAARELRDRLNGAQSAQTPQGLRAVTPAQFGRIIELDARRTFSGLDASSIAPQAMTSANNVPSWVEWLVANPRSVGSRTRAMARMLVESAAHGQPSPAQRAALALWVDPPAGALAPIERQWSLPNAELPTLEAAWRLAADLQDFHRISGFYSELYRRSHTDDAGVARARQALFARNEAVVLRHLAVCDRAVGAELPRGDEQASWLELALASAVAKECAAVASVPAINEVRGVRAAIDTALQRAAIPLRIALFQEYRRISRDAPLSAAAIAALVSNPRTRGAVLTFSPELWSSLPASERTDDNAFRVAAQTHAAGLLGALPDRIEQTAVGRTPQGTELRAFAVNSSETPTLPPVTIQLAAIQAGGALSPSAIARVDD